MTINSGRPPENNHTLLGAIRQKESAITRQLAAARDDAEKEVEAARQEARQLVDQAAEDGRREGEAALEAALEEIEHETTEIESQARKEADALTNLDEAALDSAVNQLFKIITGRQNE